MDQSARSPAAADPPVRAAPGQGSAPFHRPLADFRDRFGAVGVGAATITSSGDVVVDAVGSRRHGSPDRVAVDDQWHIGSCAKSITAALYGRLVECGAAEWGVPIAECFPDLAGELAPEWSGPTVDEVLVCRSGMRANLPHAEMDRAWKDDRPLVDQRTDAVRFALSRPPRGRGAFRYSNLGYVVVGAAIDRLAAISFEDALRRHLLDPLGVQSLGFGPPLEIWGHKPRLRLGSVCLGRGAPVDPHHGPSDNPAVLTSAGRLHLSLADWARFQHLFLTNGGDLLEPATVERLLAVPTKKGRGMAMGWAPATGLRRASYGMQGSNTYWAATALIDDSRGRTAMVVVNDGRTRVLRGSALLAAKMLELG